MRWLITLLLVVPLGLDLYMPVPEANPITGEKIELGRGLFRETRLSRDQSISCASCHDRDRAFSDGRPVAIGIRGQLGRRNAPALINRGYGRAFFWDGRAATLEEQVLQPIQDPKEMDMGLADVTARIGLSREQVAQARASYVRSILSGNAPYDRFVGGDRAALSNEQQDGLQIFRGKGNCTTCHVGPTFTDERFHNTGIAWREGRLTDDGRAAVTGRPEDRGAFKTPTPREVARTAPYMHDGSLATLDEVIDYYDRGGNANGRLDEEVRPLRLAPGEKRALRSFLDTLTGTIADGN